MAKVFPFRAFHYNTHTIGNLSDVIIPPYDVISETECKTYRARSPYNFAHVDMAQCEGDDYTHARNLIEKWRQHQILSTDNQPGYYLYRQTFKIDGTAHTRDTLMAAVELRDFADGVVRPHENTFGKAKTDRLQILRQTRCNLSHIFGMVKDPEGVLNSLYEKFEFQAPLLHGKTDDGVDHAIWKIEAAKAPELATFFEDKSIYIVDGHHRYESALMYAKEVGALGKTELSASKVMFAIANAYDPALVVFPTHRIVNGVAGVNREVLDKHYHLIKVTYDDLKAFVAKPRQSPEFCLWWEGQLYQCTPKHWEKQEAALGRSLFKLSVYWSDEVFLKEVCGINDGNRKEKITYDKDLASTWDARQKAQMVVFHAPPAITDIMDVADDRKFMPQKSTYFFPKLAAGLVMRDITA
jgi:uncharacterized protein (DUF1015 family)